MSALSECFCFNHDVTVINPAVIFEVIYHTQDIIFYYFVPCWEEMLMLPGHVGEKCN